MADVTAREFWLIRETPFLRCLPDDTVQALVKDHAIVDVDANMVIVGIGDPGEDVYIILEGGFEVFLPDQTEGYDTPLVRLHPGDFFGEQALLRGPIRRRTASVRALAFSRLLCIPSTHFLDILEHPANSGQLPALQRKGNRELYRRLVNSLDVFKGLKWDGTLSDLVSHHEFKDGEPVIEEGNPGEAAYFVLQGQAIATKLHRGEVLELSRIGPGQCFGELALLEQAPRAATVRAEGKLRVLRVGSELFLRWVREIPELRDFLHTLRQVYRAADGGVVTVHRGLYEGMECITSVRQQSDGSCLLASKVHGTSLFSLTRSADATDEPDRSVTYTNRSADVKRQLHISGGQLVGLVAEGPWPNLGQFYQRVASGAEVDEGELAYFEIQGDFAQPSAESDTEPLCYCMQIHRSELLTAVSQGCNSVFELTEQTGAGSICGGCHTCLNQLMEESSGPFGPKA